MNVIIEIAVDCEQIPNIIILYSILGKCNKEIYTVYVITKINICFSCLFLTHLTIKNNENLNLIIIITPVYKYINKINYVDVPIFTFCAMYSFSLGYYAICQGPGHRRKYLFYRITQVILIIAWFVFSIIKAGPFDGWTKIHVLSECNLGFSIFLAVVQNLLYYTAIALGIYCLIKAKNVS